MKEVEGGRRKRWKRGRDGGGDVGDLNCELRFAKDLGIFLCDGVLSRVELVIFEKRITFCLKFSNGIDISTDGYVISIDIAGK